MRAAINVSVVGGLPAGLPPLQTTKRFPIVETTGITTDPNVYATIDPAGELQIVNYASAATSIFSFDGIEFDSRH